MIREASGLPTSSEPVLDGIVSVCNEMQSSIYHATTQRVHHDQSGPMRWRESCDRRIAVARDVLQFRIILEFDREAEQSDSIQITLNRTLGSNLVFDRLVSTFINGKSAQPTNHSLNRTLDLHFHRVPAESIIAVTYQTRVSFNAETQRVLVGDTNVDWSWVSQSRSRRNRAAATAPHAPTKMVRAPRGVAFPVAPLHKPAAVLA
ncbi:hypothetical protein [Aporhodopirellula aestuarii]|uniref:Uncharacterized protein n=1 Tax=Aporhodopirellula aestuarii TaxID=2950107 RepID=A0ABT0TXL0_9BACT|nr:hypothetical protein [Aporhodopirellula aestuarii]MCM2369331.1 hypothetical protein [Aporhodopirellula aestuarii]